MNILKTFKINVIHNSIGFLFALLLLMISCDQSPELISPQSERVTIQGRHLKTVDQTVRFAASGVSFSFNVTSDSLVFILKSGAKSAYNYNWFSIYENNTPTIRFKTEIGKTRYAFALKSPQKKTQIQLVHDTEGGQGSVELVAIQAKKIEKSDSEYMDFVIEFIGDSITCGFGNYDETIPCGKGTWFDQHAASRSYAHLLAKELNATALLTSVSGIGVSRHWRNNEPIMRQVYESVYVSEQEAEEKWDFSQKADWIIIGLGTNDFSDGDGEKPRELPNKQQFITEYIHLMKTASDRNHTSKFILTDSPMLDGSKKQMLNDWLVEIADLTKKELSFEVVTFTYQGHFISGCVYHPSEKEHVNMKSQLYSFIQSLPATFSDDRL
jgi:lysophospholipase L1-like esterase